jgi:hypothetical protein
MPAHARFESNGIPINCPCHSQPPRYWCPTRPQPTPQWANWGIRSPPPFALLSWSSPPPMQPCPTTKNPKPWPWPNHAHNYNYTSERGKRRTHLVAGRLPRLTTAGWARIGGGRGSGWLFAPCVSKWDGTANMQARAPNRSTASTPLSYRWLQRTSNPGAWRPTERTVSNPSWRDGGRGSRRRGARGEPALRRPAQGRLGQRRIWAARRKGTGEGARGGYDGGEEGAAAVARAASLPSWRGEFCDYRT